MSEPSASYMTPGLETWRRWTDVPLIVLAIGSLPLLLLDLMRDQLSDNDKTFLQVVNVVVLVAFAVDYFVELALASDRGRYARHEWTSLAIVVAQGLAVFPLFRPVGIFRAARGARPGVVLLRVVGIGGAAASQGKVALRRHAASLAIGMAGLTWISSAVAFAMVEAVGEDQRVSGFLEALWWSAATVTTVGYGDVTPVTAAGRCIGMVTMVVGISAFAIVTAKAAEFLVRSDFESAAVAPGPSEPN